MFFDTGVRNAILRKHATPLTRIELGHLFEQWLYLQLLSFVRLYDKHWKLSSFCSTTGQEVDLLVDTGSTLLAIEVKFRPNVSARMGKGLCAFERLSGRSSRKIIVYTGTHRQLFDEGIEAVPYTEFLTEIIPTLH